uniref:Integrase core domain containing protein n=1 Tax=Solanum tuberosum TaxID=4113 RepID=M1DXP1_SOLTU
MTDLLPSVRLLQVVRTVEDITGRATCRRPHLKINQALIGPQFKFTGSITDRGSLHGPLGDNILKARRHDDITQGKSEYPLVGRLINDCTELVFCFSGTMGPRRKNANQPALVTTSQSEGQGDSEASGSEVQINVTPEDHSPRATRSLARRATLQDSPP